LVFGEKGEPCYPVRPACGGRKSINANATEEGKAGPDTDLKSLGGKKKGEMRAFIISN